MRLNPSMDFTNGVSDDIQRYVLPKKLVELEEPGLIPSIVLHSSGIRRLEKAENLPI